MEELKSPNSEKSMLKRKLINSGGLMNGMLKWELIESYYPYLLINLIKENSKEDVEEYNNWAQIVERWNALINKDEEVKKDCDFFEENHEKWIAQMNKENNKS